MSKFKVGDRVRVYHSTYIFNGTITSIDLFGLFKVLDDNAGSNINICSYHPKQLRRLKPKVKKPEPPKEVWVNVYESAGFGYRYEVYTTENMAEANVKPFRLTVSKYTRAVEKAKSE